MTKPKRGKLRFCETQVFTCEPVYHLALVDGGTWAIGVPRLLADRIRDGEIDLWITTVKKRKKA